MDAQHTPGPWRFVNGQYIRSAIHQIARIWMMRNGEGVANGWLIAAAPDLLAALEEARNGLMWYRDSFPHAVDGSDDEAMARIDAAIARARGGDS